MDTLKNPTIVITAFLVLFAINTAALLSLKKPTMQKPFAVRPVVPTMPPSAPLLPPKTKEPDWVNHPAIRSVTDASLGAVLADIESHMPAGHVYRESDKVTWAHETTHGINSNIRNQHGNGRKVNGFYCLNNRAAVIDEPNTTIRAVAQTVPPSLRGQTYNLYLVTQAGSWNNEPLYIFDEWVSYTNGSAAGIDLAQKGLWHGGQRSDTVLYALEFNVYSLSVAMSLGNYENEDFKTFLRWHLERVMGLYEAAKSQAEFTGPEHDAYLSKMRTSSDAENFRVFVRNYFGAEWCRDKLGF